MVKTVLFLTILLDSHLEFNGQTVLFLTNQLGSHLSVKNRTA